MAAMVDAMVRRLHPPVAGSRRHFESDPLAASRDPLDQLRDDGFVLDMTAGNARPVADWKM